MKRVLAIIRRDNPTEIVARDEWADDFPDIGPHIKEVALAAELPPADYVAIRYYAEEAYHPDAINLFPFSVETPTTQVRVQGQVVA